MKNQEHSRVSNHFLLRIFICEKQYGKEHTKNKSKNNNVVQIQKGEEEKKKYKKKNPSKN